MNRMLIATLCVLYGCSGDSEDTPVKPDADADADTDTDTDTDADADTDTDTDSDTDTDTDADTDATTADTATTTTTPCVYPVASIPAQGPIAAMPNPVHLAVDIDTAIDAGQHVDYLVDGLPFSTQVRFFFLSAAYLPMCVITYELDSSFSVGAMTTSSGGVVWETYELVLQNGNSTCGVVAPSFIPSGDLRDVVEAVTWEVGFGEMTTVLESVLEPQVTAAGEDWINDWEPYVFSMYVDAGNGIGDEVGYVFEIERDCEIVDYDAASMTFNQNPVPFGPPLDEFYLAISLATFTL